MLLLEIIIGRLQKTNCGFLNLLQLSMHYNMKGFELIRYLPGKNDEMFFPPALELIMKRTTNHDGVYRIESRHPLLIEVYGFP